MEGVSKHVRVRMTTRPHHNNDEALFGINILSEQQSKGCFPFVNFGGREVIGIATPWVSTILLRTCPIQIRRWSPTSILLASLPSTLTERQQPLYTVKIILYGGPRALSTTWLPPHEVLDLFVTLHSAIVSH